MTAVPASRALRKHPLYIFHNVEMLRIGTVTERSNMSYSLKLQKKFLADNHESLLIKYQRIREWIIDKRRSPAVLTQ